MTTQEVATIAAKGIDTADFLDHIAWTEVIKPALEGAKAKLTKQLVDTIWAAPAPNQALTDASRERIAGQIFGIDYAIKEIENIVRRGREAEKELAAEGIYLQD